MSARVSEPCSFTRRLQDRESDTGYDTPRDSSDGARDGVSQTAVYDTCGSATPAPYTHSGDAAVILLPRAALLICTHLYSARVYQIVSGVLSANVRYASQRYRLSPSGDRFTALRMCISIGTGCAMTSLKNSSPRRIVLSHKRSRSDSRRGPGQRAAQGLPADTSKTSAYDEEFLRRPMSRAILPLSRREYMDFFEKVRRLTIRALFSDDVLFDQLVLKGGNALTLVHGFGQRASFDLDFSLKSDFTDIEDSKHRAFRALEAGFSTEGYTVFDRKFVLKPVLHGPDERPWLGGYELSFKLLKTPDYERLRGRSAKMQREALHVGRDQERKLKVDISKHEYVEGKSDQDLDYVTIRVYTPAMVAAEKLRALCQQMPEYVLRKNRSARARDFYDIFLAVTGAHVDLQSAESQTLITEMFAIKRVPLRLLGELESQRNFHRPDWPSVIAAVPDPLKEFDFYFDFVLDQVRALEPIWNV